MRIGGSILLFLHIPADVDLEGEYDGSDPAFEHIMLTFRISEQQCNMEFDSVSKFHRVPTW